MAKAWRKVCGDKGAVMPAPRACFLTIIQNITRLMAVPILGPRCVTNKSSVCLPASKVGRASARYLATQRLATSPNGTSRSLLPLPNTRKTFSDRLTLNTFSVTSSLTRRPLAYISSSMVRSRTPSGVSASGAQSNASTCASVKVLGTRSACLAACSLSVGSTVMKCSRSAQRK